MESLPLAWTCHPARDRPRDVALVAAVVLVTAGAVLASFESWFFAALAVVIVLASVAGFVLPTRYCLSEEGVEERRLFRHRFRPWAELRRLELGPRAALVSPFSRPTWLDRHRALVLRFDDGVAPLAAAILRARIPGAVEPARAVAGELAGEVDRGGR
jgi:hypothetical protein